MTHRYRNKLTVTRGERGNVINREFWIDIYTLLYIKWIHHKDLLYNTRCVHAHAQVCQTPCSPIDWSARLLCHGIFQARILECIHFLLQGSFWPRDWICISSINRSILYHWATSKAHNTRNYIQYLVIMEKNMKKNLGLDFIGLFSF